MKTYHPMTKRRQNRSIVSILVLATIFFLTLLGSCSPEDLLAPKDFEQSSDQNQNDNNTNNDGNDNNNDGSDTSEFSLDNIQGDWFRIGGNNPNNNGMKLTVTDNSGKIIEPEKSGFKVGDIKWKDIKGTDVNKYTHLELGSDYSYYSASFEFGVDDTLRVQVDLAAVGDFQKWVREENFTPQSKYLEVLQGFWVRVGGNNPANNGVEVEMTENTGKVTVPKESGFDVGAIKWKDIYALDGDSFTHMELGSDGSYYSATMEIGEADTLRIHVDSSGPGNIQKWVMEKQD